MSGKQNKKIRQLFTRTYKADIQKVAENIAKRNNQLLKPKPKYFPEWLWIKLLSFFINIKND